MNKEELKELRISNLRKFFENKTLPLKDKSLISQLMSGKSSFGEKVSRRLEDEYGMGHLYLDMQPEAQPDPNVTELSRKIRRIPIVSWVQAGNWSEIEILNPKEYDWVLAVSNVSNRAFALRVQGDSMQPEFTEGDVIICDPEAQWNSGSYIVVMQDDHATFKCLVYDGARPMLKALNPVYGVMPLKDDAIVCGVVKEKVKLY